MVTPTNPLLGALAPGGGYPGWNSQEQSNLGSSRGFSLVDHYALYVGRVPGLDGPQPVLLGNVTNLSRSAHRDVYRVLGLGRCYPLGVTRSSHMLAGTLEFSTFSQEAFMFALWSSSQGPGKPAYATELPPFDILSTFVNDTGEAAYAALLGVVIVDYGWSAGLAMPTINETYTFMAQQAVPLQPVQALTGMGTNVYSTAPVLGGSAMA